MKEFNVTGPPVQPQNCSSKYSSFQCPFILTIAWRCSTFPWFQWIDFAGVQQQTQGFQPQIFPSRNNKNMFKDSTHHYFGHGCSKSSTFRNLVGWVLCFFWYLMTGLVVLTYPNKISVISTNYPKHGWSTINMVSTPQIIIGCIPVISDLWYTYIYIYTQF